MSMDEDIVPAIVLDVVVAVMQEQTQKAAQQLEDSLERIKHDHVEQWVNMVRSYQAFIDILDHPNGGPEKLKALLRQQIKLMKGFAEEDE